MPPRAVSLDTLKRLLGRLEEQNGPSAVSIVAAAMGIDEGALRTGTGHATVEQVTILLAHAARAFPNEAELRRAVGPRPGVAPLGRLERFWLPVDWGYVRLARRSRRDLPGGPLEVEREGRGHPIVVWSPRDPERVGALCPLVAGWLEAVPLAWDLPRAVLTERKCVRRGDSHCEFEIHHGVNPTLMRGALGLALGVLFGVGFAAWLGGGWLTVALSCIVGVALGHLLELDVARRASTRAMSAARRALDDRAALDSEAARRLTDSERRNRGWIDLLEEELGARTEALERITEQIHLLQRKRKAKLQGFSHDVRNPLAAIRMTTDYLVDTLAESDDEVRQAVEDLSLATDRMETLLGHLLRTAASDSNIALRVPVHLPVPALVRSLALRLRGLVHGRPIAIDVVLGPNAPAELRVDPVRFDRILDNLITNAAKYTERGAITVTLDGHADQFVARIEDTGVGMSAEQLERVFFGRDFTAARSSGSGGWGFGLAVVVRLLAVLGGRLHVDSARGRGSTFEVRLPLPPSTTARARRSDPSAARVLEAAPAAGRPPHDDADDRALAAGSSDESLRAAAGLGAALVRSTTEAEPQPTDEPIDAVWRRVVRVGAGAAPQAPG